MKPSHGHTSLLIFACLVTILVIALYGYVEHMINVSVEGAAKVRNDLSLAQANDARDHEILATYDQTKADWERLPKLLISATDTVSFIESVESIGQKSGSTLKLDTIDADNMDAALPGTVGEVRAHVTATGSWPAVMRAVLLSENLPYHSTIGSIQLTSTAPSADPKDAVKTPMWSASFGLKASMMTPI